MGKQWCAYNSFLWVAAITVKCSEAFQKDRHKLIQINTFLLYSHIICNTAISKNSEQKLHFEGIYALSWHQ